MQDAFIEYTSQLFGEERWQRYLDAFNEPTPVSIRLNPFKVGNPFNAGGDMVVPQHDSTAIPPAMPMLQDAVPIPWCRGGYWLTERPKFTLDPLLHAGCYYVQEAGSMFLDRILQQHMPDDTLCCLDLCAAPGGKSTLLRAAMPSSSVLFSNEPDRHRANILVENLQKQGHPGVFVTSNYPLDFVRAGMLFDVILADVPCSGEGLFRRDAAAMDEWSVQNVMRCAELQRSIVRDIWPCLRPGGLLIYSTCTFNTHEDEENARWIQQEYRAEMLSVDTEAGWNITGSLLEGFDAPVYRFIPGTSRSEGLFMCVLRKHADKRYTTSVTNDRKKLEKQTKKLRVLYDGIPRGEQKGRDIIPAHAEALSISRDTTRYPMVELTADDALRYLHREAITLPPDTPRGYVIVTFAGHTLGFMKHLGNRANNLYPKEWAIKQLLNKE